MKSKKLVSIILHNEKIHLLILFIFFLISAFNIKNYGISWDEQSSRAVGFINGKYILEVFFGNEILKDFTKFFGLDFFDKFINSDKYIFNTYAEKAYGPGFELPMALIELISNLKNTKDIFILRHFVNFTIFCVGLIFFYKFLKIKLNSSFYAFLGCCLLALSPRIYAHAFFNSKDIIFLSYLQIANYYGYRFTLDNRSIKNILLFSSTLAIASAVRPLGLILLFFYLCLNYLRNKEFVTKQNLILIILSMVFLYIFWPHLWSNPIKNFYEAFFYFSQIPWTGNVFFFGGLIDASSLPFYYLPTWIFITTPEIVVLLFLCSICIFLIRIYKTKSFYNNILEDLFFLIFFIVVPIFLNILLKTILFDGWRHFYFIYPFVILASMMLLKYLVKEKTIKFFEIIICLNILFLIFWNISNNPFQYLYYNNLLFGKNTISLFEKDYWGISNKQSLEFLNKIEKTSIPITSHGSNLKTSLLILNPEDQKKFYFVNKDKYKDKYYVFINNRYLSKDEMDNILKSKKFIYKVIFKDEFINGIYIENNDK